MRLSLTIGGLKALLGVVKCSSSWRRRCAATAASSRIQMDAYVSAATCSSLVCNKHNQPAEERTFSS